MRGLREIGILDRHPLYARRLSDWIEQNRMRAYRCQVFSSVEEMEEYIARNTPKVLLIDEEFHKVWDEAQVRLEEADFNASEVAVCWVTECQLQGARVWYRYQSMVEMMRFLDDLTQDDSEAFTDFGAVGKQSFDGAFSLIAMVPVPDSIAVRCWARELAKECPGKCFCWFISCGNDDAFAEQSEHFIYDVKMKNTALMDTLGALPVERSKSAGSENTVLFVPPVRYPFDYRELNAEEILWLVNVLQEKGFSHCYVYVDVGLLKEEILALFDEVWLLKESGAYAQRVKSLEDFLQNACEAECLIKDRMKDEVDGNGAEAG